MPSLPAIAATLGLITGIALIVMAFRMEETHWEQVSPDSSRRNWVYSVGLILTVGSTCARLFQLTA